MGLVTGFGFGYSPTCRRVFRGGGDSHIPRLNAMSTNSNPIQEMGDNTTSMATTDVGAVEAQSNRNTHRRRSQELEKARRQKKRDESRPSLQFRDETTPNVRATRRAERRAQRHTTKLSPTFCEKDIPQLRERWVAECQESFETQPDRLPPLREINHRIPLIDENKRHNCRQP